MTHAIVLVEADRTAIQTLGGALADVDGVREVYSVTGEWDFVAILHVKEHADLAPIVTTHIGQLDGVLKTQTMVAFEAVPNDDLEAVVDIGC